MSRTTTTTTETPETPETLAERAAQLRAEAGRAEAELRRQDAEKREALAARQEAHDRRLVADWDPRPLDAEIQRTAEALEQALRDDPLVQALAAAHHAQARRRFLTGEVIAAQGRLGRDLSGARLPDAPMPPAVGDLVARTVERLSAEQMAVERADLEARRDRGDSE